MKVCCSCGRETGDYVAFPCPGKDCKKKVVRCKACKEKSVKWACKNCGAGGP